MLSVFVVKKWGCWMSTSWWLKQPTQKKNACQIGSFPQVRSRFFQIPKKYGQKPPLERNDRPLCVPGSKLVVLGMVIQPLMTEILFSWVYKPLRNWVDEFIPYYMERTRV